MFKSFPKNATGRDFVVGDIHGAYSRLEAAMARISFDASNDRLFSVGDLIDRGPESERVLEFLAQPWFHAVRGNHEAVAIDYARGEVSDEDQTQHGGSWFVGMPQLARTAYVDAFDVLPNGIEIDIGDELRVGIVHADCPLAHWDDFKARAGEGFDSRDREALLSASMWSRARVKHGDTTWVDGVAAVFVGHTPVKSVLELGNVVHIDTGAFLEGRPLTVIQLRPADGLVYQVAAQV
ncbi:metallophosphoesterase [Pararobbsia silviterrae]|uniref:Serine/threonine protein phosphatase n=1 Tax=Pararobbsia silviterrae TaxID=1792498 RepID=A0A494X1Y6_9BURK|nr:metallophosphoesterase [Pararobbsia silviterrae]RKP44748.1 serine/threonine protein phosphatase [Pararobbsia silviterrae]